MAASREERLPSSRNETDELAAGSRLRLERDWRLPMNERLARMQALCKEMTAIAGSATRR